MAAAGPAWRAARATGVRLLVGEGGMKRQRRGGKGKWGKRYFPQWFFSADGSVFRETDRRTDALPKQLVTH